MEQIYYETNSSLARAKSDARPKKRRIVIWAVRTGVLLIWIAVGVSCFYLARYYINDIQGQLDRMAETNRAEVIQLNEKMTTMQTALDEHRERAEVLQTQFAAVESELSAVKEEMSLAGDSLSTTAQTKQALNNRINDLSKELANLRTLIKKLEEAARVY